MSCRLAVSDARVALPDLYNIAVGIIFGPEVIFGASLLAAVAGYLLVEQPGIQLGKRILSGKTGDRFRILRLPLRVP